MDSKPSVLIAGVTGMLGSKIAAAILDKGEMEVKGLVRSSSVSREKPQQLDQLVSRGMVLVEGDLLDPPSLNSACEGVYAIISAVSGNEEIVVTGQRNLIEAAEAQGVKRMIPSDYSVDYRKLDWGDNYNLDMRKRIFDRLQSSKLDYTLVLNGVFTEVLFGPFGTVFDFDAGTFSYWGDGETLFDTTTTNDTAKYVAEAVADSEMANAALQVAGDVIAMKQLLRTYQEVTGKALAERQLGSVEDLKAWIEQTKAQASSIYEYLPQQYAYTLVSGKGKLDDIQNARYPHIISTNVRQFISQAGV
jgi:uncharacterized protein YbjT (DUF2867 family)